MKTGWTIQTRPDPSERRVRKTETRILPVLSLIRSFGPVHSGTTHLYSGFHARHYYTPVYFCSVFTVPLYVSAQALPVHCSLFVFSIYSFLCVPSQALPLHCCEL